MKKKIITFLILIFTCFANKIYAQEGIYIYSQDLPGAIASGVHRDETLIKSFSKSTESSTSFAGGGGVLVGKAVSNGITILKSYNKPSLIIKEKLYTGTFIPKMEFRFYNNSNVLYYKITIGRAYVVNYLENGEACPTGTCPGISEEIKFVFGGIKEEDLVQMTSECWSFITNSAVCP